MEKKICSKCGIEKELNKNNFEQRKDSKDGFRGVCRDCRNDRRRSLYVETGAKWTDEEINILKGLYVNTSNKEISEIYMPNRSISQITDYATKVLGLHKEEVGRIKRLSKEGNIVGWSEDDDKFLIDNYMVLPKNEIIRILRKDFRTITTRARKLGLYQIDINNIDSKLGIFLRRRVGKEWKKDSLSLYNNVCYITGTLNNLEIHHQINLETIVSNILKELNIPRMDNISDYKKVDLDSIVFKFREYHKNNLGVPIEKELHILFHRLYGYRNNTSEQLEEFKNKYLDGQFKCA